MCKGTKKTSKKVTTQKVAEWESSFKMRLESERQKSKEARGDGGGGGKGARGDGGGKGGKGGRGASRE